MKRKEPFSLFQWEDYDSSHESRREVQSRQKKVVLTQQVKQAVEYLPARWLA